jgi:hypothetical protein
MAPAMKKPTSNTATVAPASREVALARRSFATFRPRHRDAPSIDGDLARRGATNGGAECRRYRAVIAAGLDGHDQRR